MEEYRFDETIKISEEYYQDMKDNLEAYKIAIDVIKEDIEDTERIKRVLEDLEDELKNNVG